jgi:hypothetical protein
MSDDVPDWSPDELAADVSEPERTDLSALAERLVTDRPSPRAEFRAAASQQHGTIPSSERPLERPRRFWTQIGGLAGTGIALLVLVALGLASVGPFSH